jgi:opacity protein-like surface antigen
MLIPKLAVLTVSIAALSAIAAPSAQAQMNENYAGVSAGAAFNDSNTDFNLGIDGRYKIPGSPFSARGSLRPLRNISVQATATYDFPLGRGIGAYAGAGVSLGDTTSPVIQAGAETKIGQNTVLYGGVDYVTRSGEDVVAKVGVAYSF